MPSDASELGTEIEWPHPKTATVVLGREDVFITSGAGGGGYGDPFDRDVAAVAHDVAEGYVSATLAESIYGVVMAGDEADVAATEERRAALRGERIGASPIPAPADAPVADDITLLSENVALTAAGDTICTRCSTQLSSGSQDFKSGTTENTLDMLDLGLVWVDPSQFVDPTFELRQLCCPTCATLLETELVLSGEPIANDRELTR